MKKKHLLLLLPVLITCIIVHACKKDSQGAIATLFTGGTWQLASEQITYYTGNSADSTVKVDTTCTLSQFFTFNTDYTCTYTNFDCITQTATPATWSLTPNQLFLNTNMVCKDTTAAGTSMPFQSASIQNLGQYSMVLQTGDIQPNYSLTKKRKIIQYGFVRIKNQ